MMLFLARVIASGVFTGQSQLVVPELAAARSVSARQIN
jgi:hypothetical protein